MLESKREKYLKEKKREKIYEHELSNKKKKNMETNFTLFTIKIMY